MTESLAMPSRAAHTHVAEEFEVLALLHLVAQTLGTDEVVYTDYTIRIVERDKLLCS